MTTPDADTWTLAVHSRERDGATGFEPLGAAVAIDEPGIADVAVLHFDEDRPVEVEPARPRAPEPRDLLGLRWWAFGFPKGSRHGSETGSADESLLHADLLRLIPAAAGSESETGRLRTQLLRLTPQAAGAAPGERAAMFSVSQALQGLPPSIVHDRMPYRARWARTPAACRAGDAGGAHRRSDRDGRGRDPWASDDRIGGRRPDDSRLDPGTGEVHATRKVDGGVTALCVIEDDRRPVLAYAAPGRLEIWDPADGGGRIVSNTEPGAMCAVDIDGRPALAYAGGGVTKLWDPATGAHTGLDGYGGPVTTMCAIRVD
ncbi:hypothetical protein ACQPZX_37265 [Actinoplanes sp. CA-142083]|uniref:hypothetical protein n=1 Tax=Actinoplanes sp. CA-142083 TaxID=3239903 RepID=UPI003D90CE16